MLTRIDQPQPRSRLSRRPIFGSAAVVATLTAALVGCGSSDETSTSTTSSPATTSVDDSMAADSMTEDSMTEDSMTEDSMTGDSMADEGAVNSDSGAAAADGEVAEAIVSISPTATEMLYAIGADDQVKAVDTLSNFPPQAVNKQSGIEAFTPNVEAIAELDPDLVVSDGSNPEFIDQLDQLGINHWEGPAAMNLDDVYSQIQQLGGLTGHVGEAAELVGQMQTDIESSVSSAPSGEGLSYYHEVDNTYYTATSDTFIGQVYGLFGMSDIADSAEGADTGYPQLSPEFIIDANPDVIYLACGEYCGDTPATVEARPGWNQITAVADGNVVELSPDVASRWGPRVVDLVQTIATSLESIEVPVG